MLTNSAYSDLIIGCVAENTPKYLSQALRLLQSVRWFGGKIANAKFIVCVVDDVHALYYEEFQKYQGEVRIVKRFSEKHPQSNKLRFLQLAELNCYKHVLLLDCDTVIVQDPAVYLDGASFRAKLADGLTVPIHVFQRVFDYFQLPLPPQDYKCTVRGTSTIPYFNAGVLLFSQSAMSGLVPEWVKYNTQLIDEIELLGDSANFCEQASLSLALAATGTFFDFFGNAMNFPIHHEDYIPSLEKIVPYIIHYHSLVTPSGFIMNSKYPLTNEKIAQFNDRLRAERLIMA
jgi:hypothetical protein